MKSNIIVSPQMGLITDIANITNGDNGPVPATFQTQVFTDTDIGRNALLHFHNRALGYSGYDFGSVDDLARFYTKNPNILFDGIGGAVREIGEYLSEDKIKDAMYKIADQGEGKIPTNMTTFFTKLGQVASNPSIAESIEYTTAHAIKDLGFGLNKLGESTVEALDSSSKLMKYLPYIAIAGGLLFIAVYAKGLGRAHGGALSKLKLPGGR